MQTKLLRRLFLGVIMLQCMPLYGVKAMILHHKEAYITLPKGTIEGQFDNGLRYIIVPNGLPKHSIEVRLVMNVGSLQEENDQCGGAHFLEHSAFIGTKHFPKRALIDYFERQGMKFGRDINAFTGFDRTIYWLSLPHHSAHDSVLDSTFLVLRDWLCAISFDSDRVRKERGVIIEELRSYQQNDDFYALKIGHGRYAERLPLGTSSDINRIDSRRLRAYYERWYTPSHATVLVIGQVKVEEVIAKLRETVGIIPRKSGEGTVRCVPLTYAWGASWMQITDSLQRESKLELIIPHTTFAGKTLQDAVDKQRMRMLVQCLSNRLAGDSVRGDVSNNWYLADKDHFVVALRGASANHLAQQLAGVGNECRRLLQLPLDANELQRLIDTRLAQLQPDTTQHLSADLCDDFIDYITAGDRPLRDANDVEWVRKQVAATTSWQLQTLLKRLLRAMKRSRLYAYTIATGGQNDTLLTAQRADEAWEQGWRRPIVPYIDRHIVVENDTVALPLCLKTPAKVKPGSVKSQHRWPELGLNDVQLTNGIRLLVRPTMDEDHTLFLAAVGRGGTADLPPAALLKYHDAVSYVDMGGLAKVTSDTLLSVMTQEQLSMTVGEDAFWHQLLASSPAKKATELFNLVYEKLCFPGINRQDFSECVANEQANAGKTTLLDRLLSHDADRLMTNTIDSLVGDGGAMNKDCAMKAALEILNIDTLTHYYKRLFANPSQLTIILTGNFDEADVTAKAIATFSQMVPQAEPLPRKEEPFRRENKVFVKGFEGGNDHQTVAHYVFAGNYKPSLQASLTMKLMRDVLQDRVLQVLRERENIVYSPYVDMYYSGIPQQKYHFMVTLSLKDENRKRAEELLKGMLDELKTQPVCTAELEKLKRSFLVTKDKILNDKAPAEWKTTLMSLVKNGESLSDFNDYSACLGSITPEMVREMASSMLDWNRRIVVYKSQKQ